MYAYEVMREIGRKLDELRRRVEEEWIEVEKLKRLAREVGGEGLARAIAELAVSSAEAEYANVKKYVGELFEKLEVFAREMDRDLKEAERMLREFRKSVEEMRSVIKEVKRVVSKV